ncbi:MAG: aminotransferase class III-fold pyridoxal phosphate-dependent enzyme, partial [Rhodothermales bacterium]|nr:aminotransferase class III-fold pyridoxal phosphate-dependent enzyme [Rhodothermales bacterium]
MKTLEDSLIDRALELIPWGTQTNAKRHIPEMGDAMPHFIESASGCRVVDTEGKSYIDYRSSLGPIILGYNHPSVQQAVRDQLDKGVLFSMASPLEVEVAEVLTAIVPGLEQVRYLKSGNEVNHVAVRLARAYTGRDLIVTCGYHGHGDWFSCGSGQSMSWSWPREGNGVPEILDKFVIKVPYGDVDALQKVFRERGDEIAGMITVPYDWNELVGYDFLRQAREVTVKHGSALIFDQILTGFRLGIDGAQGFFDVIPDLTTYGKAIANGYPLAVVGGVKPLMHMFDQVMITTTHAGETLSLAAAMATLKTMQDEPVFDRIRASGQRLQQGFDSLSASHRLKEAKSFGLSV